MKPSKFIRPNECLTVAEIYRRQFGGTTTPENYGVYMQAILLRDPLIYVDYTQCLIRYIGIKISLKNLLTR